ncbi:hypothetical protein LguiA_022770 [Lonicera macranthoides]
MEEKDVFASEEDGGCRIEGLYDLKKRNIDDVYEDKEGLSSSLSSSEGSGAEVENLKKKSKFDKVVEEDDDDDDDEDEDEDEEADADVDDEDDLEEDEAEEGSKFTREEVEKIEVKPEEYKVELSEEEREFYKSPAYLARPMVLMKKADEGFKYYHYITDEELRIYNEHNQKSEGFDIPLLPGAFCPGMKVPNNLTIKSVGTFVAQISKCALMFYNNKNGTNYVLKCLKKSNAAPTNMLTYYITFEAISAVDPDHTVTFQAKVHREFTSDIKVRICRIKE